jgi:hypothetical protein
MIREVFRVMETARGRGRRSGRDLRHVVDSVYWMNLLFRN